MNMRYLKIDYNGYIFPIRTNGPIVTPLAMDEKVALKAVISGYRCTEVDLTTKKEVKLTVENFYKEDRFGKVKAAKVNTPAPAKTVVETKEPVIPPKKEEVKPETTVPVVENTEEVEKNDKITDIDLNDTTLNKTYNFNDKKNKNKK